MKKTLLFLASLLVASQVGAASITVYADAGYRGTSRTFEREVLDLREFNLNDAISSLRIDSGSWEICHDIRFQRCQVVNRRDNLADLSRMGGWNDAISSLRPVGDGGGSGGDYGGDRAAMTIYSDAGFRGRTLDLRDGGVSDLRRNGWNDEISSFRIHSGTWEICRNADYRDCEVVSRRDREVYDLGSWGWNDAISSLRPVTSRDEGFPDSTDARAQITLYDDADYRGQTLVVRDDGVRDLRSNGWNDRASSFRIERGTWEVCRDADFRDCVVIRGRDRYTDDLSQVGWNDAISSLRPIRDDRREGGFGDRRGGGGRGDDRDRDRWRNRDDRGRRSEIVVYEHEDFRGESLVIDGPIADLRRTGWNDRISSWRIDGGLWEVCRDSDFRGCEIVGRDRDVPSLRRNGWNDAISSLRPVD